MAIPQRELDRAANTKLTAIKFLQDYPALTTEKIRQNLEEFHLTGQVFSPDPVLDSTALDGFMCLNGQFVSSAGVTGTSNGVLDFIDPASQTDVVQDLAKSKAYGYYNQYKQISSWSADGAVHTLKPSDSSPCAVSSRTDASSSTSSTLRGMLCVSRLPASPPKR